MTPQTTELNQRVSLLEKTVADLRDEIQGYKELFAGAARNPMAKQVLAMLGIKPAKFDLGEVGQPPPALGGRREG